MLTYTIVFFSGYLLAAVMATIIKDNRYEKICQTQQERGDYWFSRYLQAASELEKFGRHVSNEYKNFYEYPDYKDMKIFKKFRGGINDVDT